jgi:hypothetical protein
MDGIADHFIQLSVSRLLGEVGSVVRQEFQFLLAMSVLLCTHTVGLVHTVIHAFRITQVFLKIVSHVLYVAEQI